MGIVRIVRSVLRHERLKRRYPGVSISRASELAIGGQATIGGGTTISERARIIVGDGSRLGIGENCHIGREVEIAPAREGAIDIGSETSIQDRCILHGNIEIGRYCILSLNIFISSGSHHYSAVPEWLIRDQDDYVYRDNARRADASPAIKIGEDCWIGINSAILGGVRIARGCVVGANSVVTADLPPYSVATGAPARVIRKRLAFTPPFAVESGNGDHLPYFEAGFEVRQDQLNASLASGGIAALRQFTLCLERPEATWIELKASVTGARSCNLRHGGNILPLTPEPSVLRFPAAVRDRYYYDFSTVGPTNPGIRVLVRNAALVPQA
jgi:acetyltransferase-like isoleucine patch superfamily enzyme